MKKTLFAIFASYFAVRLALYYAAFRGSSDPALAEDVARFFTPEDVARGFEYLRWGYAFKVGSFLFACAYFAACLFGRVRENSFDRLTRFFGDSPYLVSAALFCEFYAGLLLARLPFAFAVGHLGEKLFGFSNMTAAAWLSLYARANALQMTFAAAVIVLTRFAFAAFPRRWHIALPAGAFIFSLAATLMLQAAVIPMFYRTTEIADRDFAAGLKRMAADNGVTAARIEQIDESTYSSHTNAFFTGFGPWKRIFLCDTLFGSHTKGEIALIYAHEMGHYVYNHEFKGILIFAGAMFALCLLLKAAWFKDDASRLGAFVKGYAALTPVFFIMYLALYLFAAPFENAISREFERNADSFAARAAAKAGMAGRDDRVGLYLNLARKNRANLMPHEASYLFFASHPRASDRIAASTEK